MSAPVKCQAQVGQRPHYIHYHRCERNGSKLVHGLHLCGSHAKMVASYDEARAKGFFDFWHWGQYPDRRGGGSFGDCR